MNKITTIVPVHKFDDEVKTLLETAIKSFVETNKNNPSDLMFVGPKEVLEQVKAMNLGEAVYIENENAWFSAQINAAAKKVKTDYFAILEYDDEFTPIWFDNVVRYINTGDDISVFLPLTEVFDAEQIGRAHV